jgi:hypothetical protein
MYSVRFLPANPKPGRHAATHLLGDVLGMMAWGCHELLIVTTQPQRRLPWIFHHAYTAPSMPLLLLTLLPHPLFGRSPGAAAAAAAAALSPNLLKPLIATP